MCVCARVCCPQPAGIYQFHWTQYLAPGIGNSVRSHLIVMYQRVGEWNRRNLEVLSSLKGWFSSIHVPILDLEDERAPSTEKSYLRKVSATAEDPFDLSVEIPWAKRSPKVWQGEGTVAGHPQGREHGVARGVSLLAPVTPCSWWGPRLVLAWRLYSCG